MVPGQPARSTARRVVSALGRWSLLLSWAPIGGDALTVAAGVLREPLWSFVVWSPSPRRRAMSCSPPPRWASRMMGLFQDLVAIQREIYLAFADRIGDFARRATGRCSPPICRWESCSARCMR